jgi:hypothetical protein
VVRGAVGDPSLARSAKLAQFSEQAGGRSDNGGTNGAQHFPQPFGGGYRRREGAETPAAWHARAADLTLWFDKDSLRPGERWSGQIEKAIVNDASAFLVYVGSRGVVNWVEAEVDLAISRATTVGPFCTFPFSPRKRGSIALPSFAKRYQGVCDPLGEGEELEKLLKAGPICAIDPPPPSWPSLRRPRSQNDQTALPLKGNLL